MSISFFFSSVVGVSLILLGCLAAHLMSTNGIGWQSRCERECWGSELMIQ